MTTLATTPTPLAQIEAATKQYADARALLSERVGALEDEVRASYRRKMPGIKAALAVAKDAQAALAALVDGNRGLFVKPRTITINGIKAGLGKGSGKVLWDDEDEVIVARIRKLCPKALAERLIDIKETPSKDALREVDGATLARLGVTIEGTGDVVIVRAADSDVDKLVKKILKEGAQDDGTEET